MRPIALYLHIPYCAQKCGYCDFNSYAFSRRDDHERYLRALEREMERYAALLDETVTVPTVFVGGGTPSLLPADLLERLIRRVYELFPVAPGAEFTVEANPGTLDTEGEKLARARQAGANRVSFGVQAFQDHLLRRLGRLHTVQEVYEAVAAARRAGFANLNLDLMYGLPGQKVADFEESLRAAVGLGPEHISAYSLMIEEGTAFYRLYQEGRLPLPPEEEEEEMDRLAEAVLGAAGYERYEVSNYARPGYRCQHNLNYWRNGEWLGLGAGAHSHLLSPLPRDAAGEVPGAVGLPPGEVRLWNLALPAEYEAAVAAGRWPLAGGEAIDLKGQMEETMILGLRTREGVGEEEFRARFGRELREVYGPVGERLEREGLLDRSGGRWRLTPRGRRLGNRVWAEFLL